MNVQLRLSVDDYVSFHLDAELLNGAAEKAGEYELRLAGGEMAKMAGRARRCEIQLPDRRRILGKVKTVAVENGNVRVLISSQEGK